MLTVYFNFTVVAGVMIIAAILHPQEFTDLLSGLLYFISIPSGYLLLTIYMLTNMHNVSWGTREVAKAKPKVTDPNSIEQQLVEQQRKKQNDNFLVGLIDRQLEEDSICGKIGQFFRNCCGRSQDTAIYDMVKSMHDKLEEMEKAAAADAYDNIYGQAGIYSVPPSDAAAASSAARRAGSIMGDRIYGSASVRGRCVSL